MQNVKSELPPNHCGQKPKQTHGHKTKGRLIAEPPLEGASVEIIYSASARFSSQNNLIQASMRV